MSIEEQELFKKSYYDEAMRYIENANETLSKSPREGKFLLDEKYVKSACGIAYLGVLKALDGIFQLKERPKPKRHADVTYYQSELAKLDKKLLYYFNNAYDILHLYGYYRGTKSSDVLKEGFEDAVTIINKLK